MQRVSDACFEYSFCISRFFQRDQPTIASDKLALNFEVFLGKLYFHG